MTKQKKLIIAGVAVLIIVVLLAVTRVFGLLGGGDETPMPTPTRKSASPGASSSSAPASPSATAPQPTGPVRDPFAPLGSR